MRPDAKADPAPEGDDAEASTRRLDLSMITGTLKRYPATTFLVVAVGVASAATGALWRGGDAADLYERFGFGLPALQQGRSWTFLAGAFLTPHLLFYIPILVLLVAAAGTYERRAGHLRTFAVVVGGQVVAALLTAAVLAPFTESGWTWARELSRVLDIGISAGGFAALGALTALMQPVWRTRTRAAATAYLVGMVLNSGLIWDLSHLFGFLVGVFAGPFLAGRMPLRPSFGFGRRTQRAVVALVVAIFAISELIEAIFPGNGGPFFAGGQRYESSGVTIGVIVFSLFWLITADGLRRGHRVAWLLTTSLTLIALVGLAAAPASSERTADLVLFGIQLLLLLATFPAFTGRPRRRSVRRAGRRLGVVLLVLFVYTAVGFAVLQDDFVPAATPADMVAEFATRIFFSTTHAIEPATTAARWFVGSIGAVWLGAILVTLIGLMYSSRRSLPLPEQDERLQEALRESEPSTIEWMLTWDGNTMWFFPDGTTVIGYRVVGTVALCLSDPVGPLDERVAALRAFDDFCFRRGWIPCLFAAGQHTADLAAEVGWKSVQVGEDSVIPLADLEFKGKKWQDVRTAINKAGKQGIRLESIRWADAKPVLTDQLRAISQGWVSDKSLPEMGFTLGTLAEADDPEVRLHLAVDEDQTVEGFTSWMPVHRGGEVVGWTVDLMRRRDDGFRAVMEYLIGESAMRFKEEGYEFISLSAAPLAKAPEHLADNSDQEVLQKLLDFLGDTLEPYYGFRSLLSFKAKFQPEFHPMYLVYPDETALLEIGLAIARAYMPDATFTDWVTMSVDMLLPGKDAAHH